MFCGKLSMIYYNYTYNLISYHIPRAFLKPTQNLVVLLEEIGGNPDGIQIVTVNRDTICIIIDENDPPHASSWKRKDGTIRTVVDDAIPSAHLQCPDSKQIVQVEFASYGNPFGACGRFGLGNCSSPISQKIVQEVSLYVSQI